jgi:small conductance mechanosensitive channel
MNLNIESTTNNIKEIITTTGSQVIMAVIVLFIGFKLANFISKIVDKKLKKQNIDESLRPFLVSIISWIFKIAVFISAANTAGFKTTSFVAILGTAGLAVGLALQGSLSNFAGGVLILILKPFKIGDVIKAQGFVGTVDKITTFSTYLRTPDNQIICIPNGGLANSPITNINQESTRRVDLVFGIGYTDDIDKARSILSDLLSNDSRVLKDPAYVIVVGELADSSVNFIVRAWVNTENYWGVHFDMTENVKKKFDQEKISIPFPQTDVHLHQVT